MPGSGVGWIRPIAPPADPLEKPRAMPNEISPREGSRLSKWSDTQFMGPMLLFSPYMSNALARVIGPTSGGNFALTQYDPMTYFTLAPAYKPGTVVSLMNSMVPLNGSPTWSPGARVAMLPKNQ